MTFADFAIAMRAEGFYEQPLSHGAVMFARPLTGRVYYHGGAVAPCRLVPNGHRGSQTSTSFEGALECARKREV